MCTHRRGHHLDGRFPHRPCTHVIEFHDPESGVPSDSPRGLSHGHLGCRHRALSSRNDYLMLYKMVTPPKGRPVHIYDTYEFFFPV